ncbi:MAG: hypothetical protein KIT08_01365 [Anaerolineales bacterium]|nr:MAG: hypothetical protein KIT08_01365 [Anaerolineales bacterium]
MTQGINDWSNISAIAQAVQEDAIFVIREAQLMPTLVQEFSDMSGMNPRKGYQYNKGTAKSITDSDDLTSDAFTPALDQTLTPHEIGLQFFITDARAESEAPESILTDASRELGFAANDRVESDLIANLGDLTGGTVGAAGTAITWGYLGAAIAIARGVNKSASKPVSAVIHGYQAAVLAKTASVAGAQVVNAPNFQDKMTTSGGANVLFAVYQGVKVYQVFAEPDNQGDFTGGVFPREAIAIDWRRAIRVRPQRDESRRGLELNMSGIYANGVWRPNRGVKMTFDASLPVS